MRANPTALSGVFVLEPKVFGDDRGFFFESYNARNFVQQTGLTQEPNFVQDNHSKSARNVLRGLHYQVKHAQGKLVRVVVGEVFDVVVDVRKSSPTFGKWLGTHLTAASARQLWVPPGYAHGFIVLSDYAEFLYKTTDYWAPEFERCILWSDPAIGIEWPNGIVPILSEKDKQGKLLSEAEVFA